LYVWPSFPACGFVLVDLKNKKIIIVIIINRFAYRHKVVTSEALGARQRVSKQRRESLGEEEVFSLGLKTATESLLRTVFGNVFHESSRLL